MSVQTPNSGEIRLWGRAASAAPIVAVFARCDGEVPWTCVLRWNWEAGTIDEGAWTKMKVRVNLCALSSDGRFLLYYAKKRSKKRGAGPFGGPGGRAVSRLPWLAALTDIEGDQWWCSSDARRSRDGLSLEQQSQLWSLFPGSTSWIDQFGPGWQVAPPGLLELQTAALSSQKHWLAACAPIPDTRLVLLVVEHMRKGWTSPPLEQLSYFVLDPSRPDQAPHLLTGVRWAHPIRGGRVAVAGTDASLRLLRAPRGPTGEAAFQVEFERSLGDLRPNPGPAPDWAKTLDDAPESSPGPA